MRRLRRPPVSDFWSPPGPGSAAIASCSCGIPAARSLQASPAPVDRRARLSLDTVRARATGGVIPAYGAIAVSTPGILDAWWTLHRRHGVLAWKSLFDSAIHFCESGVPVPQIIGYHFRRDLEQFRQLGRGDGRMRQRDAHLCAGRARAPGGRYLSQPGSRAHLRHDCRGRAGCLLRGADRPNHRCAISSGSAAG